jgi:hypothetical protein
LLRFNIVTIASRMATNFVDFQQALIEGYIILTDMGQQEMEAMKLRKKLCSEGNAQQANGASLRWVVGVNPSSHTELVLQAVNAYEISRAWTPHR